MYIACTMQNAVDMCLCLSSDERALVLGAKQLGFVFHTRLPERVTITVVSILPAIQRMKKRFGLPSAHGVLHYGGTLGMDRLPTELELCIPPLLSKHERFFYPMLPVAMNA